MTPYEKAYEAFHKEPTDLDWSKVLDDHLHGDHGFILKTPDLFVCAREVNPFWPIKKIVDDCASGESSSCLHVSIVAGDLKKMLAAIPSHIKAISFQKHGYKLHIVDVSDLRHKLKV